MNQGTYGRGGAPTTADDEKRSTGKRVAARCVRDENGEVRTEYRMDDHLVTSAPTVADLVGGR